MKDKKTYIILGISILFMVIGISYAYFSLNVIGNDTAKNNKIVTGNLELTFTDTEEISLNNMLPGDSVTKIIKVTNTGSKEVIYNVGWTDYNNEITNNELIIEGTCKRLNSSNTEEGTCNNVSKKAITGSNIISNIQIEPNVTHEYTLTITFKETNKPQNYNKNKSFNGKLNITESTAKTVYCTFDGELVQGAEYVNGQYTYRYMQEFNRDENDDLDWINNFNYDGWGVTLTDKTSTDPVTSELCTYINDKPIVSMSYMFNDYRKLNGPMSVKKIDYYIKKLAVENETLSNILNLSNYNTSNVINMEGMFYGSNISTIDLSSFDTSNVTNMSYMFYGSDATTLDLSSFDTSNVTNMSYMFYGSDATTLDLSSFDTSNVTDMSQMFGSSDATALDLSGFNTSNVTNMEGMFWGNNAITIDVSNFDTSNVLYMNQMFYNSQATALDLSNFDTSKVEYMSGMFSHSQATTIDLSNFDTSKVTNMDSVFEYSQATSLDLSSFNTSNVTNMSSMFSYSKATTIDLSSFDTSKVTNMSFMFYESKATTLDLSSFDTSKVTNMRNMFNGSKATILDLSNFNTSNVTNMNSMFSGSQATMLDLSSFDTSKVTDMSSMFSSSQATILDLSSFDTSKVTDMVNMFAYSTNLKTIYVSNKFNTSSLTVSYWMFSDCTSLVGGSGTAYNSDYTGKTYARIDGGTSNPGYFTAK